jgi:flagellin-like protein
MGLKKRGISPVVSEVLIVVVTVVAIAAVAAFLVPFIRESLKKGTECLNYDAFYTFDDSSPYNCYDAANPNVVSFSIKTKLDRALAEEAAGFEIVLSGTGGASKKISIEGGMGASHSEGGIWMRGSSGNIEIPGAGETITYAYKGAERYKTLEVYPRLKSGRICSAKDSIELAACKNPVA